MNLVLVEDEPLLRDLLAENLAESGEHRVIATFGDGAAALAFEPFSVDVAVIDIDLGAGPDGLEVARRWRATSPSLAVVFLSNLRSPGLLLELPEGGFGSGGIAYLHKRSATSVRVLVDTIALAAGGEVLIDPVLLEALPETGVGLDALTPHQRRILEAISTGASNRSIADALGIPVKSVENATASALRALGIDGTDPGINVRVVAALTYLRLRYGGI